MPNTPKSQSWYARLLAQALSSRIGAGIGILFAVFEIYQLAFLPIWKQTVEIELALPKLEIAQREADAAVIKQTGEAQRIAEEARIKTAEANAAAEQARADADKAEAEAKTAGETAAVSPQLIADLVREKSAEAAILLGQAGAARDQAKANADRMEAQAKEFTTKAQTGKATLAAKIVQLKDGARADQELALRFIGTPLPAKLQFESAE